MQGPNAETISTMVDALKTELATAKEVLEVASQDTSGETDLSSLVSLFQRTSDILSVVGLKTPGRILAGLKSTVERWVNGGAFTKDGLLEIADGLLYVEKPS